MLIRFVSVHGPGDPAVVSADTGGHPGIGDGGMSEQRCDDAWLREAAGLLRACRREGKGPPPAVGRRRPFALVTRCQGALENE